VIAGIGYQAYRTQITFRQIVRVFAFYPAQWLSSQTLLLVGDSRVEALHCGAHLPGWSVLNLGVSGLTARDLQSGLGSWIGWSPRFDRSLVWIGVNDLFHHHRSTAQVMQDLQAIVETLAARSTRVALVAPIPVLKDNARELVNTTNQGLSDVQQRLLVSLAGASSPGAVDELVLVPMNATAEDRAGYADPLHLNSTGNAMMCALVARWLLAH
jgi:lysophospholipase L1-like esterase